MKRFFSVLGLMAIMAGTATYAQVEIGYAKEGGDTQYDAVKFFSIDGKYAPDKQVTLVVFTDKMDPKPADVKPDGPASMNGAQKCLLHSGAGANFWEKPGTSADGTKTTFDSDGWRNDAIGSMTLQAPNIFSLSFVPKDFYKTDVVTHYGMVFNDGKDGKAEGKDNGADYKLIIPTKPAGPIEIGYIKEGGDTQYDAIKFYSEDGKYDAKKPVTMVAFTDKMDPKPADVKPDGAASMNGAQKCLLHSGAGANFWEKPGTSEDGTKTTFDSDGWRNDAIGNMTLQAPNIFSLTFTPSVFYKTDVVTHYGMVFNDGKDGKAEGKDNGADYKLIINGTSTSVKDGQGTAYDLSPVYPNPTSNQEITMINYRVLNTIQRIAVKVYDMQGNIVRTIVDEDQTPAQYMVYWDKNNDAGIPVVSGSYIYVIQAGQYRTSNTIIVNN
jgi:hypothetical protein